MATLTVILKDGQSILIKSHLRRGGKGNGGKSKARKHYSHSGDPPVLHQYTMDFPNFVPSLFDHKTRQNTLEGGKITPVMHLTALIVEKHYL
jgi:hypothetical protein